MSKPTAAFLSDVVDFLEETVLPEPYDERRYFDNCVARADDRSETVKVKRLSFCRKNSDGDLLRVNDILSESEIHVEFHFTDGEPVTDSWGAFLSQVTVRLETAETNPPPVLKWESTRDQEGNLKHDEWFGPDEEYLSRDVSARDAIRTGVEWQLYEIIAGLERHSSTNPVSGLEIQVLYDDCADVLDALEPPKSEH